MAANFSKSKHTRGSEYLFLPQEIDARAELNGRHDLPNIEWLIADILKRGQHTPVTVRNEGGRAVLVAGFSRWRAISEINKRNKGKMQRTLRATFVNCGEEDAFLMTITENRMRNPTTELDDAHNIKMLQNKFNMQDEEIAQLYFPTASPEELKKHIRWVRKTAKLASLTKEAEKAVKAGRVKGTAVAVIAEMSAEQQREVVKGEGQISGKDVKPPRKVSKASKLSSLVNALLKPLDGALLHTDTFPDAVVNRKLLIALYDVWSAD